MKRRIVFLSIVLSILSAVLGLLAMGFLPASVNYTITETYIFSTENETEVTLTVFLPKDGPYQTLSHQEVEWAGSIEEERDAGSLDILTLRGTLQPGTHEARITYAARLRQGTARWEGDVDPVTLQPQSRIESDHPEIQATASMIGDGASREDAYEIMKYVSNYLTLPTGDVVGGRRPTALSALQSRLGVCDDYAHLMVGLLRAREIPSRVVWGLAFGNPFSLPYGPPETKIWNHTGVSHAWVEVFTGEKWEKADPTWAKSTPWLYFGRTTGSHLSYGDAEEHEILYQEMMDEANRTGQLVGAMSAPLKINYNYL